MRLSTRLVVALSIAFGILLSCMSRRPARFSHETHLVRQQCGGPGQPACLSCASCHRTVEKPDVSLPAPAQCASCHDDPKVLALARPPADALQSFSRTIRFSHDRHLAMPELRGQCVPCHAGLAHGGDSSTAFPPMEKCFECHEHRQQWERATCAPCHERRDIENVLPRTFLRHDAGFVRQHATVARSEEKMCMQCHSQKDCDDCHDVNQRLRVEQRFPEALERNFVHRGDYIVRHSIEARTDSTSCMRCHSTKSCDDCHLERGISAGHLAAASPHPPGWVGSFTEGRSFHGSAARRDLLSCAACHDQGPLTNCISCHRVGAYGGNPHPGGWRSARTPNDTMCGYCHAL